MSIIDGLKKRVIGSRESPPTEDELKSAILGPYPQYPNTPAQQGYPKPVPGMEIPEVVQQEEPSAFSPLLPSQAVGPNRVEKGGLYEIMDRLSVIETQMATVRAQTETINERLKTMELLLRRQLPREIY
jgi:hypothetical protein